MFRLVKASRALLCITILMQVSADSIVVRHDVPDNEYRVSGSEFPWLVYLPEEGQGVLIAPEWVVTAAHATTWRPIHDVVINGIARAVNQVVVHPGYRKPSRELQSGDAAPLIAFLANSDDIALIKLQQPVTGVAPVRCYQGRDEVGKVVEIVGAGATGNGLIGQYPHSPHRGELRRAEARVNGADQRWLTLRFDAPPKALPHEGMPADGDSGAPVLMRSQGRWELAGLVSHKFVSGKLKSFRCCLYGQITYQVRISQYVGWIDGVIHRKLP